MSVCVSMYSIVHISIQPMAATSNKHNNVTFVIIIVYITVVYVATTITMQVQHHQAMYGVQCAFEYIITGGKTQLPVIMAMSMSVTATSTRSAPPERGSLTTSSSRCVTRTRPEVTNYLSVVVVIIYGFIKLVLLIYVKIFLKLIMCLWIVCKPA